MLDQSLGHPLAVAPDKSCLAQTPPQQTIVDPALVYTLGIEDIRKPSKSDWDYNDVMVQVTATPIPGGGTAALGLASVLVLGRVRRRR